MIHKLLGAALLSCVVLVPFSSHAELAVGSEGKFKDMTEIASSQLHKGALATTQSFLGSVDIHDIRGAEDFKKQIILQLKEAARAYRNAENYAGQRQLKPSPGSEQDSSDIKYF